MKLNLAGSVVTTFVLVASVLPAKAGPLDTYGGSMLDPTAGDPTALCSDKGLGNDAVKVASTSDVESTFKSGNDLFTKAMQANSSSDDEKTGGGISFMGIGANASHESKTANSSSSSDEMKKSDNLAMGNINKGSSDFEATTVRVGKDCSAVAAASAARDAAAYNADAMVKSTQIATDGKVKATEITVNGQFMQNLLKW